MITFFVGSKAACCINRDFNLTKEEVEAARLFIKYILNFVPIWKSAPLSEYVLLFLNPSYLEHLKSAPNWNRAALVYLSK